MKKKKISESEKRAINIMDKAFIHAVEAPLTSDKVIDRLQKELTKDGYSIRKASDIERQDKILTGIFGLDYVLSGGVSVASGGHRIELFGAESSGKTTLALYVIKKFQELGKLCAFVDGECSYDKEWGEKLGVDNEKLLIITPNSLEEAGNIFVKIIPQIDLLVVDSIVSLIPVGEAERNTEEAQMALSARINALITRKIYHAIGNRSVTMIFINQLREKVGVMYGSPYTTGGGHALLHFYQTRIEVKKGKPIEEGTGDLKEKVGIEVLLNCVKNKRGKPYRKAEIDFYLNGNLDNQKSLFFAGVKTGLIQRNGNTYEYKDHRGVGQEKFLESMDSQAWQILETEIWGILK